MDSNLAADNEASVDRPPYSNRRKRVKRACDNCSRVRSKCDGELPCRHCLEYDTTCAYTRVLKRRGRTPKAKAKEVSTPITATELQLQERSERQQSSTPIAHVRDLDHSEDRDFDPFGGNSLPAVSSGQTRDAAQIRDHPFSLHSHELPSSLRHSDDSIRKHYDSGNRQLPLSRPQIQGDGESAILTNRSHFPWLNDQSLESSSFEDCDTPQADNDDGSQFPVRTPIDPLRQRRNTYTASSNSSKYHVSSIDTLQPNVTLGGGFSRSPESRFPIPSDDLRRMYPPTMVSSDRDCRYPVLQPLLPYISTIIPTNEACDLLDLYFTEPSTSLFECASPYVLTQIFRKKSFLCRNAPRPTSPALLAAMLWVTAQTSNAQIFKADTRTRLRICDQLNGVCMRLLNPEVQGKQAWKPFVDTGDREYIQKSQNPFGYSSNIKSATRSNQLDDILTYSLLGTVISGGDAKGECLKWWTKAWTQARALSLNREQETVRSECTNGSPYTNHAESLGQRHVLADEEAKEERRRIWWLLYIVDRHLALSYNAPLNILDAECQVYQPLDETTWQELDLLTHEQLSRFYGPSTKITGVGLFEYFLPLMAILGDIVDIHHRSCHPRSNGLDLEGAVLAVENSLLTYEASLAAFEGVGLFNLSDGVNSMAESFSQNIFHAQINSQPWSHEQARKNTVISYSKHLLHVLHVLLHGSWDPISMLDDTKQWVTPKSFVKCAQHAIFAASAVSDILAFDPELSFMPYLFGIYLMHGSFILLIFADKMKMTTSDIVIQACETLIRAHEVCVTTLNTDYQRNFRKVLRSALYNLRGTMVVDIEQHKSRRREFLSLYKWNRDGKGLIT